VVRKLQNFGVGFAFSAESFGQKRQKKKNSIFVFKTHQYQKILHFISLRVVKNWGLFPYL